MIYPTQTHHLPSSLLIIQSRGDHQPQQYSRQSISKNIQLSNRGTKFLVPKSSRKLLYTTTVYGFYNALTRCALCFFSLLFVLMSRNGNKIT